MKQRLLLLGAALAAALLVILLRFGLFANAIHSAQVDVKIHSDGSATVTELREITMDNTSNTEYYVAKHNLDNMQIRDLQVWEVLEDGTQVPFETLDRWDTGATRQQKSGKCGLLRESGGYEICWGFGEFGRHQYVISYTITNLVKGYEGGDVMSYRFIDKAAGGIDTVSITLSADDFGFVYPDTRVWVFGYRAESVFADGEVVIQSDSRLSQSDYAAVMLAFEPGLLSPADRREESAEDIIALNMDGSAWEDKPAASGSSGSFGSFTFRLSNYIFLFMPILMILPTFLILGARGRGRRKEKQADMALAQGTGYCRELPYSGNLAAAYVRLYAMDQVEEGAIIGCFLLQWIRSRQVEIIYETKGWIAKREEPAIRLYSARPDMPPLELRLYNMIIEASGKDYILQSKEFERWARKRYSTVESWLAAYRNSGRDYLEEIGATAMVPVQRMFGLSTTLKRQTTPYGQQLTRDMFGFKRYLGDFTIINEREAKEVELWDQYLVFAQLFGIADQVAAQFRQLYPDFFTTQNAYNHYGYDATDIITATVVSRTFSHSLHVGYRAGAQAAASGSSSSGGGGSSSYSGGGGGASGGGGEGGR